MHWTVPTPLLVFATVVALLPLAALVRRPMSVTRLVLEAFVTTWPDRRGLGELGHPLADRATLVSRAERLVLP